MTNQPSTATSGYLDDLSPTSLLSHLHLHSSAGRTRHQRARTHRRRSSSSSTRSDVDDDDDDVESESESEASEAESRDSWDSYDSEEERRLAQLEWDEGIRQLQLTVQVLLCPFLGKYLGRQWSYWAFARYRRFGGLTARFFSIDWLLKPATNLSSILPKSN
ncbi:uncharacterized protein PFL1_00394 [Pseudozyma flocculosa PF-1]|uniref:uncharacterized protein n=1 Tax=Pseudozyma flocculosa PF-1 TaxID=1277687 RepID=UPI0004561838|nr:uncharacterized protein PFL1_00394 [Pseudozyma flocculosa PF-1]EPQ32197.1 hypothetical protein PFL1_00394 [Pseudozyma flocculosa PF-1]